jgi:3-methyladenine DNA glycosylase AlkD
MKSAMPYHGVVAAEQRALTNAVLANHSAIFGDASSWRRCVLEVWDRATHREQWYAAITLARHRAAASFRSPSELPTFEHMVRTGAWWDVVDEIAAHLVGDVLARHRAATTPVLRQWMTDESLWIRRVAILAQLHHKRHTDTSLLADAIDANLEGAATTGERGAQDFFIRKAIGWALREYHRTDPAWVRGVVEARRDRMAPLTVREALKHS